mgnify:CR=1 FL=1
MNYSWLLYCAVSTVYINALLTNMCFEEMKRILAVFFNGNSVIRIMITALPAAASQPLIAWLY